MQHPGWLSGTHNVVSFAEYPSLEGYSGSERPTHPEEFFFYEMYWE